MRARDQIKLKVLPSLSANGLAKIGAVKLGSSSLIERCLCLFDPFNSEWIPSDLLAETTYLGPRGICISLKVGCWQENGQVWPTAPTTPMTC